MVTRLKGFKSSDKSKAHEGKKSKDAGRNDGKNFSDG